MFLVLCDVVCTLELNHFYDDQCKLVFDQYIFYDEDDNVIDWRMIKSSDYLTKGKLIFHDVDRLREVRFTSFKETWTQYDPELENRSILPKEKRRGLSEANKRMVVSPDSGQHPAGLPP